MRSPAFIRLYRYAVLALAIVFLPTSVTVAHGAPSPSADDAAAVDDGGAEMPRQKRQRDAGSEDSTDDPVPGAADDNGINATQTFTVYNFSGGTVEYKSGSEDGSLMAYKDGREIEDGVKVKRGESVQFKAAWGSRTRNYGASWVGEDTTYGTNAQIDMFSRIQVVCQPNGTGRCDPPNRQYAKADKIWLYDAPGTVISIYGDEAVQQLEVLQDLCDDDAKDLAMCEFNATEQPVFAYTAAHNIGERVRNNSTDNATTMIRLVEKQETTDSVGITMRSSFSVLGGLVTAAIESSWDRNLTEVTEFWHDVTVTVPPGHEVFFVSEQPVERYYGTFDVKFANTQWHLEDVYFEYPDPSRAGRITVNMCETSNCSATSKRIDTVDAPSVLSEPLR